MKLIKINTDHYIIVDSDSEIDYDNEPYLLIKDDYETYIHKHKGDNKPTTEHYKITHSTNIDYNEVYYIPLSEVKELIGEVDVEKKAEKFIGCKSDDIEDSIDQIGYDSFIRAYNQALEDNKDKKYTEEDVLTIRNQLVAILPGGDVTAWDMIQVVSKYIKWFDEYIQSFQPKTEWEVEMVDGKLKLI